MGHGLIAFNDMEARLHEEHYHVSASSFLPEDSTAGRERTLVNQAKISQCSKADVLSEHIAGIEPRLQALRAKHYMFWFVADPYETLKVIDFHDWFCNKQHPVTVRTSVSERARVYC